MFLFSVIVWAENASIFSKVTYEILYKAGVDAYLENRWDDCVGLIEKSIEDYIYFRSVTVQCRKRCSENEDENIFSSNPNDSDIWHLQTVVTNKALCLMKCQNLYFQNRPKTSKEVDEEFEKKVPYNYLQLCYFKVCSYYNNVIFKLLLLSCGEKYKFIVNVIVHNFKPYDKNIY